MSAEASAKARAWVGTQKVHSDAAVVLQALADEASDEGICGEHDVSALGQKCGIPVRSLHRVLIFLKATGRLFVHPQYSPEGLRIKSRYELNLDRPADTEFAPRNRRTARVAQRSATLEEPDASSSATLAQPAPHRSATFAGHGSQSPAMVAERHATLAHRAIGASAGLAEPDADPTTVVVSSIREQQQGVAPLLQRDLARELRQQVHLGRGQVRQLQETYGDDHLRAVLAYVMDRHQRGLIQPGKIAGYFLSVVKNATSESLAMNSPLDAPAAPVVPAEEVVAAALEAAKREANRKMLSAVEARWSALPTAQQEEMRATFMAYLAEENPIVHAGLRRKPMVDCGLGYRLLLQWFASQSRRERGVPAIAGEHSHE